MSARPITTAMLLAAGLGTRMRPLSERTPKPLIEVAGKPLIAHALDRLKAHGVKRVVMNVHWLADQLIAWANAQTPPPEIVISDERDALLETGGGIAKALPLLGEAPFFVVNTDSIWLNGAHPALARLEGTWDDARMDVLLLLVEQARAVGHAGGGDFLCRGNEKGSGDAPCPLLRAEGAARARAPVFTGIYVLHPRLFAAAPEEEKFSMNLLFDAALGKRRLFGLMHSGTWLHVGTPEAIAKAEKAIAQWPAAPGQSFRPLS